MDGYNLKEAAYEAEVKRQRDQYGQDAEAPHDPGYPLRQPIGLNVPVQPPAAQLAELTQQVAKSGHMLMEARAQSRQTRDHLSKCEAAFTQVSEALLKAIYDLREGTPENVPYGPH